MSIASSLQFQVLRLDPLLHCCSTTDTSSAGSHCYLLLFFFFPTYISFSIHLHIPTQHLLLVQMIWWPVANWMAKVWAEAWGWNKKTSWTELYFTKSSMFYKCNAALILFWNKADPCAVRYTSANCLAFWSPCIIHKSLFSNRTSSSDNDNVKDIICL